MIYSFYGIRRSGNHAIIEWLLYNMGKGKKRICLRTHAESEKVISRGDAIYFNDVSRYASHIQLCYDVIGAYQLNHTSLIVTYEDKPISYELIPSNRGKIIIIRDIINVIASRIKNSNSINKNDMIVNQDIIDLWCEHASTKDCIKIVYEKWLTSKSYRDEICNRFSIENLDNIEDVYSFGGGSSFVGKKLDTKDNLLNRHKSINFSKEIIDMISANNVVSLRKELGYI